MHNTMGTKIWPILFLGMAMASSIPDPFPKCFYGERGSLTATCVNADSSYFRMTTYRFDRLDETVQCQNCTLTTISANSFDISGNQIRNLVLNDSKIETIQTKAFIGLIFLENLVLSHNTIRSIHPGTFSGIQKVKTIDLSHNNVIILSEDGFGELVNLEQLNLASNFIETITQFAFRGLHSLKELQLEDNHIRELRDVLVNLTSLVTLNLDNNNLQSLNGDEFRNLSSLAELKLSNNKLSSPVIELLPNNVLKRLDLRNNDIRELRPQFLQELRVLEHLDLSNNHIASLDRNVFHSLFGLRQLDLSFNDLTLWQTGVFSVLPQLELLNCSHNDIVTVEITGVFNLNSLYALDLSHNVIRNLDYLGLVDRLPRLSYLQLEKNLLPCDLEDEIETNFQEDNFKFVVSGSNKSECLDEPVKASVKMLDKTVALAQSTSSRVSGAEIALMVLMSVVFMCIAFLFFIQYRTYQEVTGRRRDISFSRTDLLESE